MLCVCEGLWKRKGEREGRDFRINLFNCYHLFVPPKYRKLSMHSFLLH